MPSVVCFVSCSTTTKLHCHDPSFFFKSRCDDIILKANVYLICCNSPVFYGCDHFIFFNKLLVHTPRNYRLYICKCRMFLGNRSEVKSRVPIRVLHRFLVNSFKLIASFLGNSSYKSLIRLNWIQPICKFPGQLSTVHFALNENHSQHARCPIHTVPRFVHNNPVYMRNHCMS